MFFFLRQLAIFTGSIKKKTGNFWLDFSGNFKTGKFFLEKIGN
jgi:hypothetical protein